MALLASELDHATAAFLITHHPRVNGCLTDKGVATVYRKLDLLTCRWASDDKLLVIDLLVTDRVWIEHHHPRAIGRTPECKGRIAKGTTAVPV